MAATVLPVREIPLPSALRFRRILVQYAPLVAAQVPDVNKFVEDFVCSMAQGSAPHSTGAATWPHSTAILAPRRLARSQSIERGLIGADRLVRLA